MKKLDEFAFTWVIFLGGTLQGQECFPPGRRKKSNWQQTCFLRLSNIVFFHISIQSKNVSIYKSTYSLPGRQKSQIGSTPVILFCDIQISFIFSHANWVKSFIQLQLILHICMKVAFSKHTNLAASVCNINSFPLITTTWNAKLICIHWSEQYQYLNMIQIHWFQKCLYQNITFGSGPQVCGMS